MKTTWKLQNAKAKFSQLVERALHAGPQFVTRRGQEAVVVISVAEYNKLVSKRLSFKEFLLSCPKIDDNFDIDRQKDLPRNLEF